MAITTLARQPDGMAFEILITVQSKETSSMGRVATGELPPGVKTFRVSSNRVSVKELADSLASHLAPEIKRWVSQQ